MGRTPWSVRMLKPPRKRKYPGEALWVLVFLSRVRKVTARKAQVAWRGFVGRRARTRFVVASQAAMERALWAELAARRAVSILGEDLCGMRTSASTSKPWVRECGAESRRATARQSLGEALW